MKRTVWLMLGAVVCTAASGCGSCFRKNPPVAAAPMCVPQMQMCAPQMQVCNPCPDPCAQGVTYGMPAVGY